MGQQVMQILQSLTGWLRLQFTLALAVRSLALAMSVTAMSTLTATYSTRSVTGVLMAVVSAP